MATSIKINLAALNSESGNYPATFEAILSACPESLVDELTGRQLALVIDFARAQHRRGESIGWHDAVETYDIKPGEAS
jgi:hypothetical protein